MLLALCSFAITFGDLVEARAFAIVMSARATVVAAITQAVAGSYVVLVGRASLDLGDVKIHVLKVPAVTAPVVLIAPPELILARVPERDSMLFRYSLLFFHFIKLACSARLSRT
jgi:hypothetical protein